MMKEYIRIRNGAVEELPQVYKSQMLYKFRNIIKKIIITLIKRRTFVFLTNRILILFYIVNLALFIFSIQ